jgi:drug/metabolite transporter (DMT)-like permease
LSSLPNATALNGADSFWGGAIARASNELGIVSDAHSPGHGSTLLAVSTPFKFGVVLLGWGLSEYLMCISGRNLPVSKAMFFNCVGLCLANIFWLDIRSLEVVGAGHAHSGSAVSMAMGTGLLYALGDYCFFLLAKGPSHAHSSDTTKTLTKTSVLAPICGLYVAVPVVLGICLQHEPLTARKCLGVLLALCAIFLLSDEEDDEAKPESENETRI